MKNTPLFLVILYMILMGIAMIIISTLKIIKGSYGSEKINAKFKFAWNNPLLILFAEYFIAVFLVFGGFMLYRDLNFCLHIALISLVVLIYFSLKNFQWETTENEKKEFAIMPAIGFIGGGISIIMLILHFR